MTLLASVLRLLKYMMAVSFLSSLVETLVLLQVTSETRRPASVAWDLRVSEAGPLAHAAGGLTSVDEGREP